MAVQDRPSLWQVLAGRAPLAPPDLGDTDVWAAVQERLNPAKARPSLRGGVEAVHQTSVRGEPFVMLRSPDREGRYVRLRAEEWQLAQRMDGATTVAGLVGEFTRISGRLAPDQVRRVVADLASHRMLHELPLDAFHGLQSLHREPLPRRARERVVDVLRGRRVPIARPERAVAAVHRCGGRLLFTTAGAVVTGLVAVAGLVIFGLRWGGGARQVFVAGDSFLAGALLLLVLNAVCLAAHEFAHALAVQHAGRRPGTAGVILYYGIPSVYVDTTDVWMANRRQRLVTSAAGPAGSVALAGVVLIAGEVFPGLAPLAFKLAFAWYLNTLFNLNPLLALDGYYLLMDWLEVPNLRSRGFAAFLGRMRLRRLRWARLSGEERILVTYGAAGVVWLAATAVLLVRIWRDRVTGLVLGLWYQSWLTRLGFLVIVAALVAPLLHGACAWAWQRTAGLVARARERREAAWQERLDALRASRLGHLQPAALEALARSARWSKVRLGRPLVLAGTVPVAGLVVVRGALAARRPGDPTGFARGEAGAGDVAALEAAWRGRRSPLTWEPTWSGLPPRVLALPAAELAAALGPAGTELPPPLPAPQVGPVEPQEAAAARYGVHSAGAVPSVWPAPGPPPDLPLADETDRKLLRKFILLLLLLLLLSTAGLVFTLGTPGRSWVEIPSFNAVLRAKHGRTEATIDGTAVVLHAGQERLIRAGDAVQVDEFSTARLTYRGGATVDLCPETGVLLDAVSVAGRRVLTPSTALTLDHGAVVSDTSPHARDFHPLAVDLVAGTHEVATIDDAAFSVVGTAAFVTVKEGDVARDEVVIPPAPPPVELGCEAPPGSTGAPPSTVPGATSVSTVPGSSSPGGTLPGGTAPTIPITVGTAPHATPGTQTSTPTVTTVATTVATTGPHPTAPAGTPPSTTGKKSTPTTHPPLPTSPSQTTPIDPATTPPPVPTTPFDPATTHPPPTEPPPPTGPPNCPPNLPPGVPPPPGCP